MKALLPPARRNFQGVHQIMVLELICAHSAAQLRLLTAMHGENMIMSEVYKHGGYSATTVSVGGSWGYYHDQFFQAMINDIIVVLATSLRPLAIGLALTALAAPTSPRPVFLVRCDRELFLCPAQLVTHYTLEDCG